MQYKRLIKWKESLCEKIREKGILDLKTFVEKNKIDMEKSNVDIVRMWIYSTLKKIK